VPDSNEEYFLYQILLGSFPFEASEYTTFITRIKDYALKALREANIHTNWLRPDSEYENACLSFISDILSDSPGNLFLQDFRSFQRKIAYYGILNSLAQVFLKITSPGVPDIYQGTELWDFSLVDPDNRRPVDFEKRITLLSTLREQESLNTLELIHELWRTPEDGRIKLYLIYRLLQARKKKIFSSCSKAIMYLWKQAAYGKTISLHLREHTNKK